MRAGADLLLLTSDPTAREGVAVVIQPGATTTLERQRVALAAVADSAGEATVLLVELASGSREARTVTWDATPTRHV
jgi:hypothetical protein